jgi:hypothetical protein
MAEERDEQATQVGHQVVSDAGGGDEPAGGAVEGQSPAAGAVAAGEMGTTQVAGSTDVFFSRDQAQEQQGADAPPTPPPPRSEPSGGGSSPAEADRIASDQQDAFAEKPHIYAAGAFVGAFVFAQILKRITGGGSD